MNQNEMIDRFFEKRLITIPSTKKLYRRSIRLFFEFIKTDSETYFKTKQNYEDHIEKYYFYLQKNFTTLALKIKINILKMFFATYDKSTKELDIWDTIAMRTKGAAKEGEELPLEKTELKKIMEYSDEMGRAAFLVLASSGMRIGEIIQIELNDIYLKEKPVRIHLRAEITKTKKQRDTFISDEALDCLKKWLAIREQYLLSKRAREFRKPNDKRVFPCSHVNIQCKWVTLLKKCGYDEKDKTTGKRKARVHGLRKFFRSNLGNSDLAEHLMGHSGYLSTYRQHSLKKLGELYIQYMPNLVILETQPDLTAVNEELAEKDKQIHELL